MADNRKVLGIKLYKSRMEYILQGMSDCWPIEYGKRWIIRNWENQTLIKYGHIKRMMTDDYLKSPRMYTTKIYHKMGDICGR